MEVVVRGEDALAGLPYNLSTYEQPHSHRVIVSAQRDDILIIELSTLLLCFYTCSGLSRNLCRSIGKQIQSYLSIVFEAEKGSSKIFVGNPA